jgi:ABC-2 type transport system ATP-binding protein
LHVELRVDTVTPALVAALRGIGVGGWGLDGFGEASTPGEDPKSPALSTLDLVVPDEDLLPRIAETTLANGARLYALTPRRASLEEIFLQIVGTEDSGQ